MAIEAFDLVKESQPVYFSAQEPPEHLNHRKVVMSLGLVVRPSRWSVYLPTYI